MRWVGGGNNEDSYYAAGTFQEAADDAIGNLTAMNINTDRNEGRFDYRTMDGMDQIATAHVYGQDIDASLAVDSNGNIWADVDGDYFADVRLYETADGLRADTNGDGYADALVSESYYGGPQ